MGALLSLLWKALMSTDQARETEELDADEEDEDEDEDEEEL